MQTQQLIEASAQIITITRLKAGDVYKRIHDTGYGSSGNVELRYGIVVDVLNNGEDGAIVAIEMNPGYPSVTVEQKVWKSGSNVALFAASPEEITKHSADLEQAAQVKVDVARRALDEAQNVQRQVAVVIDRINSHQMSYPATVTGSAAKELAKDAEEVTDVVDRSAWPEGS